MVVSWDLLVFRAQHAVYEAKFPWTWRYQLIQTCQSKSVSSAGPQMWLRFLLSLPRHTKLGQLHRHFTSTGRQIACAVVLSRDNCHFAHHRTGAGMMLCDVSAKRLDLSRAAASCFGWAPAAFDDSRVALVPRCGGAGLALPYRIAAGSAEAVLRYEPFVVVGQGRVDCSRAVPALVRHVIDRHSAIRFSELNPTVDQLVCSAGEAEIVRTAQTHIASPPPCDLSLLSKRTRRSVARSARTPWQVEVTECHRRAEAWEHVLEIEHASWKHREGSSILDRPEQLRFYRQLLTTQRTHRTFAAVSHLHGYPAAHIIGTRSGHLAMLMKWSYRAELRPLAPGFYVMWWVLRWLNSTGTRVVDFCSNDSTFAAGFATHAMTRRTLVVR